MKLAVTVGFDATFVIRALARLGAGKEFYLLFAVTGGENDKRSLDTVNDIIKVLRAGSGVAVDLRNPASALERLAGLDVDAMVLAGGPRLLVLLAFVAAVVKKIKLYVVTEYQDEPLDLTPLVRLPEVEALTRPRLAVLSALDGAMDYREVASKVGLDSTTVLRHLNALEQRGLVERVERSVYRTDALTVAMARLYLQQNYTRL
ncbi:CRISPR locus-related DNA-binding protein [Pyrobaculum oguniense TE7]|uniref:CRISPR locus-related DNA-binding protein n=1 Tax=Pyrobaculum oguniense (strain DSM 13380 / JCM 10595 / TE7) TaxID=698757 RepID=H6QA54_PYROT|nr:CRISPR locus-related DNA-binding protein [Pyrobaculum oguniense TE7]